MTTLEKDRNELFNRIDMLIKNYDKRFSILEKDRDELFNRIDTLIKNYDERFSILEKDRDELFRHVISGNKVAENASVSPTKYWHGCSDQWWGGYTFAQHGDDLVVVNIFNNLGIKDYSYIDIGAHHPFNISNTALLYQLGKRGINIEANPNLIKLFNEERPEDKNINIGIGVKKGVMPFYMIDDYSGRNSFSKEAAEEFVKKYSEFSITKVQNIEVKTLDDVISEYCDGRYPEFMSIDIEGLDYAILEMSDLKNGPIVIDVEVECSSGDSIDPMILLLEGKGYKACFRAGANMIFVKKDYYDNLKFFS